ncbi:uroporphyrinogen decarboxylase family protein [Acidobacteriota bacterium]
MTNRELLREIIDGHPVPRCGFWLGNPHPETWELLHQYFGTSEEEELRRKLGDDFRWISPQFCPSTYKNIDGDNIFHIPEKNSLGEAGPLANCSDPDEVDDYDWPDPERLDFQETLRELNEAGEFYRASGFWTPFFHDIQDLFGLEHYLSKMYTHPHVVHAVTDRVCQYYFKANEYFYDSVGGQVDGFFFGNDFGTQADLILHPDQFEEFLLPWIKRFTEQAKRRGYQVLLHSCGSIERVIDNLIDAGINCLHPIQARAARMDAVTLSTQYRGRIVFFGGIDTQDLLVNAAPDEIRKEVLRVKDLLGPNLIVSPSHEALLPNVPPENIAAMADTARQGSHRIYS